MNLSDPISPEDLSLFALQLLSPEESAAVSEHLAHSASAREELARIQGDLCALAMTAELHTPPASSRDRLMSSVAREKKVLPFERSAPAATLAEAEPTLASRSARSLGREDNVVPIRRAAIGWAGWIGWAAAAGIAVFAGLQFQGRTQLQRQTAEQNATLATVSAQAAHSENILKALTSRSAMQVAMHLPASDANEPPVPQGHTSYVPGTGTLVFVATHMPQLQNYKTYELWVLPKSGRSPIPAGLFKPDSLGNATVTTPDIPKGVEAQGFGVTVENDGGSHDGPTKPIVLVGLGV